MADVSDVRNALVNLIGAALYPSGPAGNSVAGYPVRVYGGWPKPEALDRDMGGTVLSGSAPVANSLGPIVNVSIFPRPSVETNTTRYLTDWQDQTRVAPTLTASVVGNVVTLGGTVTAGNYVSIICENKAVSYIVLVSDTLASIATALATRATAQWGTSSAVGAVVTLPAVLYGFVSARCAAPGTAVKEVKRQKRAFQITVWAGNDAMRAAVAGFIDALLGSNDFVSLPDQTQAFMLYQGQNDSDVSENQSLYRRDIFYWVEYATTLVAPAYPTTVPVVEIEGNASGPFTSPANWPSFNPQTTT